MRMRRLTAAIALGALVLLGAACAPEPAADPSPTRTTASPTPTPTATADPLDALTLEQRVGQLFMVGTPVEGADPATLAAVAERHAGGVFLHGRSDAGTEAIAGLVSQFTSLVPAGSPPLWVATDQEGGDVQVLSGPGFDDMPTALTQAQQGCGALRTASLRWGGQLAAAGVNVNLAPVLDIVTSPETARQNPPIGRLGRHYGYDQPTVAACAGAFAQGMRVAGVLPTFKHFPGLGRAAANTDYATDVVDTEVTADAPDVDVYRMLLAQGTAIVMLSTAVYEQIDPGAPAAFSPAVVTDLLRGRLGFDGVVMTDDLSAPAQVARWSPADRALLTIGAGADVVLVSADPAVFAEMYDAVLARAQADPAFAESVDAAARRVLALKSSFPGGE
ncbi:glycoside hydrolase family 3 N-terminal domain-containing protein [Microbacterium sp. GXF7504]